MKTHCLHKPAALGICSLIALVASSGGIKAEEVQGTKKEQETRGSVSMMMEEVLISARRKSVSESAQTVPIAVSAFSESQMRAAFVENLTDVGLMAPNVSLEGNGTFPAAANFFIRGVGINTTNPSDDPTVGVFVDGMYYGVNLGVLTDTFDLESVEVLRGPQGTLFGRNVTGGAVVMKSKRPTGELGLRAEATIGDYGRRDVSVAIEGPLADESLAGKLAVLVKDHDGYFDNVAMAGSEIGGHKSIIVRPMITWMPNDDFELTLIGEHGDQEDLGTPSKSLADNVTPNPVQLDKFDLANGIAVEANTEWKHVIAEARQNTNGGAITATLTWRELEQRGNADLDGSETDIFHFVLPSGIDQDQLSAEVTYAAELSDRVDVTTGLYYFTQDLVYTEARDILGGLVQVTARGILEHSTYGAFVQSDIDLTDEMTLTLGGRYTVEEKEVEISSFGECDFAAQLCTPGFIDDETWNDFTPKVGLSWLPHEDFQLYASWTKGFRSGGYGLRNSRPGTPGPYEAEDVSAYEIGMKSDWFENRLRFNMALFRNEFSDLQRQVLDQNAAQSVLNAAEATIQGVEVDLQMLLAENFSLQASYAHLDAGYDSFNGLDLTGDGVDDPDLAKNLDFVRAPETTYSVAAIYDLPFGNGSLLSFRGALSHVGKRAGNDANTFFFDSYDLVDASVTYTSPNERLKVSLFGKNLTDELYTTTGIDISLFTIIYAQPPRTWGLNISYEFF